jgi:hypothetical protein
VAAGGAQLVFVGADVDGAPAGRGRAALPQWAALAADVVKLACPDAVMWTR